jgi:hypothetical protein
MSNKTLLVFGARPDVTKEEIRPEGENQGEDTELQKAVEKCIPIQPGGMVEIALRELGARVIEVELLESEEAMEPTAPSPN